MEPVISSVEITKIFLPLFLVVVAGLLVDILLKSSNSPRRKNREQHYAQTYVPTAKPKQRNNFKRGTDFELHVKHLLELDGYAVRHQGGVDDGGIDLIATKNNETFFVQCKAYETSQVKIRDIQSFYGILMDKGADSKGIYITSGSITRKARDFAKNKSIQLIDGQLLARMQVRLLGNSTYAIKLNSQITKRCPRCGGMLSIKKKNGSFLACANYPKCSYTKPI